MGARGLRSRAAGQGEERTMHRTTTIGLRKFQGELSSVYSLFRNFRVFSEMEWANGRLIS